MLERHPEGGGLCNTPNLPQTSAVFLLAELLTFWTGRGAVSTVMDATSTASGGSQRSAASAATGATGAQVQGYGCCRS
ncbi:hypothetical protein IPC1415_30335 [Pseudomonas aeruginosa]|nr:hypothetical protein IPC1415_30335 [Pseudomonas aeruginosa]